jgi:hypothetical protein
MIGLSRFVQDPDLRGSLGMGDDYQIAAPLILCYPRGILETPQRVDLQFPMLGHLVSFGRRGL